jgi:pimeloyl-ACP methyl ester carboxylesterase
VLLAEPQIVAFDNRGAGRSGKPDIPYSIELMAADTIGLMDRGRTGCGADRPRPGGSVDR